MDSSALILYIKEYKTMKLHSPNDQLRVCNHCILPETFPGISFNEEGVCNHCQREASLKTTSDARKEGYKEKFNALIENVKDRAPTYDAIMAYSGGKDSSYTLKLLKNKYDIRILAFTFDNNFLSSSAKKNIEAVTEALNIDLINFKPQWHLMRTMFVAAAQKEIFSKAALLRASSICTTCITMVKSLVLKTALEMDIPLVAFGWSPGQAPIQSAIMKTNASIIRGNQKILKKIFTDEFGISTQSYFIPDQYYEIYKDRFPYNIHPLAFFDYNEDAITDELKDIGWNPPMDTDSNSTNCLLNAFANQCHLEQYGFHPYVFEIANMVRHNIISREDGIQKIYTEQNDEIVVSARNRLGLSNE